MTEKTAPLGFSQQHLWFLLQYPDRGPARFNANLVIELFGPLDVARLGEALSIIEARHEPLRTCLRVVKGLPVQMVMDPANAPLDVLDLSRLPEAERARALEAAAREEETQPLDFVHGPVHRARLLRLRPDAHVLLWTANHVNIDAWSFRNLLTELRILHEALGDGRVPALPELSMHYTSFTRAERMAPSNVRRAAFWREYLEDATCHQPPHRQMRPKGSPSPERTRWVHLEPDLYARIDAAARGQGCTRFSLVLAALVLTAHRWSGEADIVTMVATAHRALETEPLIGSFADMTPVRIRLSQDAPERDVVSRAQAAILEVLLHEMPLARIEEATGRAHRFTFAITDHVPFESHGQDMERCFHRPDAFALASGHLGGEVRFRASTLPMRFYRMDLVFIVRQKTLICCYQPDLFTEETIDQVLLWWAAALGELTKK